MSHNFEQTIPSKNESNCFEFSRSQETLKVMGESLHENSKSSFNLMNTMLEQLNMKLPAMGLEEDQEEFILSKIEIAVDSSREASDIGENINSSFSMVISQLQASVDQQNELLDSSVRIQQAKEININQNSNDSGSMNVELF